MKIFLSIVLIHFFIIVPFAEEKLDSVSISYREIITTEDHFSISLPNNWIEIPSDTIKTLILHLKESYPKLEIPNYKYGFQPDSLDSWFDLPYILVKVNTDVNLSLSSSGNFLVTTFLINFKIKAVIIKTINTIKIDLTVICTLSPNLIL